MDINKAHRYSHLGEKMLCLTDDTLVVKLTGTIGVYNFYTRSNATAHSVINKTYMPSRNPRESVFVNTTGPFPESLIVDCYWIGVEDD